MDQSAIHHLTGRGPKNLGVFVMGRKKFARDIDAGVQIRSIRESYALTRDALLKLFKKHAFDDLLVSNKTLSRYEKNGIPKNTSQIFLKAVELIIQREFANNKTRDDAYALELAEQWEKNNYEYKFVERGEQFHLRLTAHQNDFEDVQQDSINAYLTMIAIHKNAGWEKWVPRNLENSILLNGLFRMMNEVGLNYQRVCFRIYYVLQQIDKKKVAEKMRSYKLKDEVIVSVIYEHVFRKTVPKYLAELAHGENRYIAERAAAVLTEIAIRWKDQSALKYNPFGAVKRNKKTSF